MNISAHITELVTVWPSPTSSLIQRCLFYDFLVSKRTLELQGGTLGVSSEGLGHGTTFHVITPIFVPGPSARDDRPMALATAPFQLSTKRRSRMGRRSFLLQSVSFISSAMSSMYSLGSNGSRSAQVNPDTRSARRLYRHVSNVCCEDLTIEDCDDKIAVEKSGEGIEFTNINDLASSHNSVHNSKHNSKELVVSNLPQKKWNLLIVDDAKSNRKMMKKILRDKCEQCIEACDGEEAVNLLRASIEEGSIFDAVLMDFVMPVMDGPTATKIIREMGYKGAIIGVTGNAMQNDLDFFKEQGADRVMIKPFDLQTFESFMGTCE